jgi:hypothetical protein
MMQIPYASFTGVEQLIPCVVAAIFAAADIKVDTKSLPKNCPSENLLKEIVRDGAVDCLLWLMDELKKAHAVFLACDKGNRKGVDHLAKSFRRVTAIREVRLELQARGFRAEEVSTLGISKLILLLKDHCQGLRADGDLISLVVPEASEPLPDQQVDGDDKTFLPRTDMMARSQAPQDA